MLLIRILSKTLGEIGRAKFLDVPGCDVAVMHKYWQKT